jgi:site-specific recombinase XerD
LSADAHEDPVDADLELVSVLLDDTREALARRDYGSVADTVDELMEASGLPEDQRIALGHGILRANIEVLEGAHERLRGICPALDNEETDKVGERSEKSAKAPLAGPKLSELLPDFLEFMTTEKGWRGQTVHQNKATYRLFIQWCGEKPIQGYTREDTGSFYDMLRKLPALYSKDKRWRDLALGEIVAQSKDVDVDRLSMKTIKRHFSAVGRLFKYFKQRGKYEGENPAYGFEFPTSGRASSKRDMWEGDRLRRLFSSPVWTGCHSYFRTRPGDEVIRDGKFWLPILGLYHGNRLEEFAQLRREDIRQEGGIWYCYIWDGGDRQTKNEQSTRRVPIHPVLHRLGFLDFVSEASRGAQDAVFPKLRPGGPDKKVGYYFTKWWTNYRKTIGVYERGLDYHSFRHGVVTKLFAASVSDAIINELVGHEGKGTAQVTYKKTLPLPVLHDAICKVEWPEVDLSHLYLN